jgi:hypothetical protein
MSEAVSAFWCAQPVPPAEEEAAVMVCRVDGKGVPIRRQGEASAPKNPNPASSSENEEKSGQKKVSLVGAAYTVDPYIRTPEQILKTLFRDCEGDSEPQNLPMRKSLAGWLRKWIAVIPMEASRWWRSWTVRNRSGALCMSTSQMSTLSKS